MNTFEDDKNKRNQQISNQVQEFINSSPYRATYLGIRSRKNFPLPLKQL